MTSSARVLFVGTILAGCGGAPNPPAESAASAPAPAPALGASESAPASAASAPASEQAAPSASASAAPSGASSAEPVAPKRRAAPIDIAVVGKHAGDAAIERVILGARTGLQNCYEAGLEGNPTAMGIVEFRVNITASGALKKVESANPNTMPGSITNCMVGKFGAVSFEPRPATTIEVKVTCRLNES